jgi:hypothetical protein
MDCHDSILRKLYGAVFCSVDRASRYNSCKWVTWCTIPFSVCLFQFSTCFEQPRAHHQENQLYQYSIWYMSLCAGDHLLCRSGRNFPTKELPDLHTRRSPTQSDTHLMMYWYIWFSWWWALGCSKHVENWNKRIEKGTVHQVGHLQDLWCYVEFLQEMHESQCIYAC